MIQSEITPHLFRTEYSKIVAVLCKTFHLKHIEIAEDIAADTFLKASESWAVHGIPENPTAWLYTVAKNKAKDYFKHLSAFETQIKPALKRNEAGIEHEFEFSDESISDSQLAMIFAVCNPINSTEAQICLALQILCGFSIEEISDAFLTKLETVKKRLLRARANLRNDHFEIKNLNEAEIKSRLDTVLKTLYLLFNEGYFSKTNNQLIRKDLCSEAIRLALVLVESNSTNTPQANALLALMFFQSSRLDARTNKKGEAILYDEQDKSLWDKSLIEKGNFYLINACTGNEISNYHLESAIAYWHTTSTDSNKWQHILDLYNQLILIEHSPITALNRTFAYAKVYGCEKALVEAGKLNLSDHSHYQGLLGYLYTEINLGKAISHYEQAIFLTKSKTEKQTLTKEIERLKENSSR
nr:DUF6596 domain-containing protein [uncultured Fluviicola sp.]